MVNQLDFTGQGQLLNTTEVKLNLYNIVLKLVVIYANLDSGSAYSFPTPPKWRANTGHNVTSHSGRISILLGGDIFLNFPTEVRHDKLEAGLFKSKFSDNFIIFGSVNPSIITWSKPVDIVNRVYTKSLTVFDIQGQLLTNKSAEKYLDSTNREKLSHIYKEKEIQEIITYTTINKDNANNGRVAPGNPNPAQHVKKVFTPQKFHLLLPPKSLRKPTAEDLFSKRP